eukprot:3522715-Rhodomonas_salina.2
MARVEKTLLNSTANRWSWSLPLACGITWTHSANPPCAISLIPLSCECNYDADTKRALTLYARQRAAQTEKESSESSEASAGLSARGARGRSAESARPTPHLRPDTQQDITTHNPQGISHLLRPIQELCLAS